MESSSLVQQGVAAYKAGDKAEAIRLFTEALRQNRDDIDAWLYLGAAIDDPARKRQAFETVLKLDPSNEKAKNALARLDAGPTQQSAAAPGSSPVASSSMGSSGTAPKLPFHFSFKLPVHVDGAPDVLTDEYCMENGRNRIMQVWDIFRNQNVSAHIAAGENATQWDSVFIAGIGVVAVAISSAFILIGYLFDGAMFRHFPFSILGVVLLTIFYVAIAAAATAGAFAASVFVSEWFLKSQGVAVNPPQHRMYLAIAFLPFPLTSAIISLINNTIGKLFVCIGITGVLPLLALALGVYLLWKVFDQVYGGADKNRGLITSVLAMVGAGFGYWIVSIVFFVIGGILSVAFSLYR